MKRITKKHNRELIDTLIEIIKNDTTISEDTRKKVCYMIKFAFGKIMEERKYGR